MVPLDQLKLWTVRLTKGAPSGAAPAGVLYRTEGDAVRGVVFFRDARADDILLFHPAAIPTDFVEEIPPLVRAAEAALPSEAAPPAEAAPAVEAAAPEPPPQAEPLADDGVLKLGAAAEPAEVPPPPPAEPLNDAAAPTVPVAPAALEAASPAEPPLPVPPAEPEGWNLPLASLLDGA